MRAVFSCLVGLSAAAACHPGVGVQRVDVEVTMAGPGHRNGLAHEASPYLLQHAANPVDWHPWGEEALFRARDENRPIFLSIGYSACHWCHVMERESFEDASVAAFLNAHFVPIKVDREERPDIDAVYMSAVQALTGSGGWPLNVFLTPDLEPFFGGTYFPPEPRWGRASFQDVLRAVADAWENRREELIAGAAELSSRLAAVHLNAGSPVQTDAAAAAAVAQLAQSFDSRWGGFGPAPKFPTPSRLFFLLDRATSGDDTAVRLLTATLDGMAAGGMWDWVGGGFHRYSVDPMWLIPHFEKMLYDNALLARAYGEAGVRLEEPRWVEVARRAADYLVAEMQGPEGGFYCSTDADSEGGEGVFFTWTPDQVRAVLEPDTAEAIVRLCRLDEPPNFEGGRSVLRPRLSPAELARSLGITEDEAEALVERGRRTLDRARSKRLPPALDDKRLAGWNGMAIWSLAWLGATLEEPRYLDAARRAGAFVVQELLRENGSVVRSWRGGTRSGAETLEDVAWMTAGLLELYQAEGDSQWLRNGLRIVDARLSFYADDRGALYEVPSDGERLPFRPRNATDGALPANPAVLADALLRLASLTGRADLGDLARGVLDAEAALVSRMPSAVSSILLATQHARREAREVVVVGERDWSSTGALLRAARRARRPVFVIAPSPSVPVPADVVELVPLFAGRERARGGRAIAYFCEGGVCRLPTGDPIGLARQLAGS